MRLSRDVEGEAPYLSALAAFRSRTAYANSGGDHLVSVAAGNFYGCSVSNSINLLRLRRLHVSTYRFTVCMVARLLCKYPRRVEADGQASQNALGIDSCC